MLEWVDVVWANFAQKLLTEFGSVYPFTAASSTMTMIRPAGESCTNDWGSTTNAIGGSENLC